MQSKVGPPTARRAVGQGRGWGAGGARPPDFFLLLSVASVALRAGTIGGGAGVHIDQPQVQTGIVRVWDETSILRLASVVVLGRRCGRSVGAESCRAAGAVSGTGDGRGHWYSGRRG